MPHPLKLVASLTTANYDQLTDHQPCEFRGGEPYVNAEFAAADGVAELLVVRCAGCGGYVTERRLTSLVVFEGASVSLVRLPVIPMNDRDRGEA